MDHILEHKTSLNRYRKAEIRPCTALDHHAIKLNISNIRKVHQLMEAKHTTKSILHEGRNQEKKLKIPRTE